MTQKDRDGKQPAKPKRETPKPQRIPYTAQEIDAIAEDAVNNLDLTTLLQQLSEFANDPSSASPTSPEPGERIDSVRNVKRRKRRGAVLKNQPQNQAKK